MFCGLSLILVCNRPLSSGTGIGAFPTVSAFTPVTYFERITAKNDSLKEIKVLSPDVAAQVKTEFNKLLLRG